MFVCLREKKLVKTIEYIYNKLLTKIGMFALVRVLIRLCGL